MNEPVRKKLKTVNASDKQDTKDSELDKHDAEMFQHVSEANETNKQQQTLDTATEEQAAIQQNEKPNVDEPEDVMESAMELPVEEESVNKDTIDIEKQVPEILDTDSKERKTGSKEHPAGMFS